MIKQLEPYKEISGRILGIDAMYTKMDADREKYNEKDKYKEFLEQKRN